MNGFLAQLIALITYGNGFLITGSHQARLTMQNSTLMYCNSVVFQGNNNHKIIAKSVDEWFSYLKKDHCKKLKLVYQEAKRQNITGERETSGMVGGGGTWLIEAVYGDHSNYWAGTEETTATNTSNSRIWNEKYTEISTNQRSSSIKYSLVKASKGLSAGLIKIEAFALKHNLKNWANVFNKANTNLKSAKPVVNYYDDFIIAENYSLLQRQVLFSSSQAWVFGGMGSWNDLLFDKKSDEKEYSELSDKLYNSAVYGFLAGIN